MPNRIGLLIHYLACFKAGLVITPLNYRYTFREIDHALEVSGASVLIAHAERDEDLASSRLVPDLSHGVIIYGAEAEGGVRFEDLISGPVPERPFSLSDPDSAAAIFFTSGSTGPPKGVTHSNESLRWMIASAGAAFELTADGRRP